jgi:dolichol-phosphate mannosyltransferase
MIARRPGKFSYNPVMEPAAQTARDVDVVIPALNERENLETLLPGLREALDALALEARIIVVDGGSSDGTREAAALLGATVVVQKERGYGGALLAGFREAAAPFVVTMDADLSHRPEFLKEFWERREEADLFIASRYVAGGRAEMNWFRLLLSRILNATFALVLSLPFKDVSSGFRMYRRGTLSKVVFQSRDFDVLEEILIRIYNQGCRIREIPFTYTPRESGRSHVRLFRFGLAYVKTLARMRKLRAGGAKKGVGSRQ